MREEIMLKTNELEDMGKTVDAKDKLEVSNLCIDKDVSFARCPPTEKDRSCI